MQVFGRENADAGHITARSIETKDQTASNRINTDHKYNRDCCCRSYRRLDGNAIGDSYGHLLTHPIGREVRQARGIVIAPMVFDRHVLALNISCLVQALEKRADKLFGANLLSAPEKPNQ